MRKLACVFVCSSAFIRAQSPIGTLEGQVIDPASALVVDADVAVHQAQTGLTRTVHSSKQGAFHFSDLPIGTYLLEVKAQGFAPYVAGSAPTLVAGENDLAQNPFNLAAEPGPSLFDSRHRFVFSGSYGLPKWQAASRGAVLVTNGWQINIISSLSTGTPFTVYDSADVSTQGSAPEISGFYSSRPNLISNPNAGQPHSANEWVSRAPFQQLNPRTQAGQFGNEGRNVVRGPGSEDVDLSLFKYFTIDEHRREQFRAECFNLFNHANLGSPENDLQSPAFGQILQWGPPRLLQLAVKLIF